MKKSPAIYERRSEGYNSYFEINLLNNSELETNRLLCQIKDLKDEIEKLKKDHMEELRGQSDKIEKIFGTTNIFELNYIKSKYDEIEKN